VIAYFSREVAYACSVELNRRDRGLRRNTRTNGRALQVVLVFADIESVSEHYSDVYTDPLSNNSADFTRIKSKCCT